MNGKGIKKETIEEMKKEIEEGRKLQILLLNKIYEELRNLERAVARLEMDVEETFRGRRFPE